MFTNPENLPPMHPSGDERLDPDPAHFSSVDRVQVFHPKGTGHESAPDVAARDGRVAELNMAQINGPPHD